MVKARVQLIHVFACLGNQQQEHHVEVELYPFAFIMLSLFWDPVYATLNRWDEDIVVTRAPGRLDVMGGIADYSGRFAAQRKLECVHRHFLTLYNFCTIKSMSDGLVGRASA